MKRIITALLVGAVVSGGAYASASTLGGLNDHGVGASNAAVSSCDSNGVTSSYATTYNSASKKYDATGVTISDLAAACVGKTIKVSLIGATGNSLFEGTHTVAGTTEAFTVPAGTTADSVDDIAVAVFG